MIYSSLCVLCALCGESSFFHRQDAKGEESFEFRVPGKRKKVTAETAENAEKDAERRM